VRSLRDGLKDRGHDVAVAQSMRTLRRELKARPWALVHVFGCLPSYTTFAAMALAKRRRLRLVWTPVFHPSRPKTWKGYGLLRAMAVFDRVAPHAARFADAVIAATEAEAEFFRRIGSRRVALIPPGVRPPVMAEDDASVERFREQINLNGGPLVLTVARENSRKALPFGIDAFQALRRRRPDAKLLLVGAGRERSSVEQGVLSLGWLAPEQVQDAYRAADVLFVPSLYEGLPRAVIEAWSFSLPVVATDRVALAPTIDGVGGRIVEFGNAESAAATLAEVLADSHAASSYAEGGRRLVEERFLLERSVERTVSVYWTLVGDA
jgi:glycosyltransferase involved in cell wall biosynthesis